MKRKNLLLLFVSFLFLPGLAQAVPGFMKARMGTMEGQVFIEGKPAELVLLTFFEIGKGLPPVSEGGMGRIPDQVERADEEGKFKVQLPEGSYYLGVLVRPMDSRPGPPRKGEKFYFADDGQGKLRQLAITDFKQIGVGRVDCSLPSVFKQDEDHFTVTGVVLRGEGANEPLGEALVLAKRTPAAMRPEYFSGATDKDGKFTIKLPPNQTFYLVARGRITGAKPNPGEDIGRLGVDKDTVLEPEINFTVQPAPPSEDFLSKQGTRGQINDTAVPVTGKIGEVISGLKIHMFKMPDSSAIKEARQQAAAGLSGPGSAANAAENGIEFVDNSEELTPEGLRELEGWTKFLLEKKTIKVAISVRFGSSEFSPQAKSKNEAAAAKKLARRRALAIKKYFQGKGVAAGRLRLGGQGAKNSVAAEESTSGRGWVEIKIMTQK